MVGHSYGGAVITEAGTHEKGAALAYIAAFAVRRCRRSCRHRKDSCFWTRRIATSPSPTRSARSPRPSPPTSSRPRPARSTSPVQA
ncbi:hypothetical protein [Amycolatopsis sp. NPDC004169]|uniref:hypothetical protein n=1 Tax=Amycolatopsis sp. NPDC004169 TaxID=3154453 RepID=UPI0033B06FA7